LARIQHDPSALADFYGEALGALGALCERTWHDRMCVVAEGKVAQLWNDQGALHEVELQFAATEASGARDAAREVFPGCPLTFRIAEGLMAQPLALERAAIRPQDARRQPPAADIAARLWHSQFAGNAGWRLEQPFQPAWHGSLVVLVRCEIQAIDQHWSAHRLVLNLATGEADEALAEALEIVSVDREAQPDWPAPDPAEWLPKLTRLLEAELALELAGIRGRQERYLRRELERIDDYYAAYEQELRGRRPKASGGSAQARLTERLAAAAADHQRRRDDQLQRYEIRVIPHWDAWLLVAEPAWLARVSVVEGHERREVQAVYVPRLRRWMR
jgi:hypothetical protein